MSYVPGMQKTVPWEMVWDKAADQTFTKKVKGSFTLAQEV